MKLLAIDIGTGTQDILLYDSTKEGENNYNMIVPSPTVTIAKKIKTTTNDRKNILLTGDVMGGGPCVKAIKNHLASNLEIYSTVDAAFTIKDNIETVKSLGINVIADKAEMPSNENLVEIRMSDLNLSSLEYILNEFELDLPNKIAIAVQDHGYSPDISNRIFRFKHLKEGIEKDGSILNFTYTHTSIPSYLNRMKAVSRVTSDYEAVFMDTGIAAIFGAILDPMPTQPCIVINVGNGHTLVALVNNQKIIGIFEHHTSSIQWNEFKNKLIRFADNELSFDEIYEEGGHGCYVKEKVGFDNICSIVITGPKRYDILQTDLIDHDKNNKMKVYFATPMGNMMLSGCYGLVDAFNKITKNKKSSGKNL